MLPDADFPGLGVLHCNVCGDPYVNHPIRPCPRLGVDVIHVQPIRTIREAMGECLWCGGEARRSKHTGEYTLYCSEPCRRRHRSRRAG